MKLCMRIRVVDNRTHCGEINSDMCQKSWELWWVVLHYFTLCLNVVCEDIREYHLDSLYKNSCFIWFQLGYFAWRNSSRGSWFVQSLVEVFVENWKRMDLMTMMTRVCRKVAYEFESNATREYMNRKKQVPCITSMLTRDVYFTPKAK